MRRLKICLAGEEMVGKTSIANRVTHNTFSQDYKSTIGIKIFKKIIELKNAETVEVVIWDIFGGKEAVHDFSHYFKGAHSIILVMDSQRKETIEKIQSYRISLNAIVPNANFALAFNKVDLFEEEELNLFKESMCLAIPESMSYYISAKTGQGALDMFGGVIRQ